MLIPLMKEIVKENGGGEGGGGGEHFSGCTVGLAAVTNVWSFRVGVALWPKVHQGEQSSL